MTTIEALQAARALLAPRGAWTQNKMAGDARGNTVHPSDDDAVCWCVRGALRRVCGADGAPIAWEANQMLLETTKERWATLMDWNDQRGRRKASVLRLIDRAIAKAGEVE